MSLAIRNLLFTVVVPGSAALWLPSLILSRGSPGAKPMPSVAILPILLGASLYVWCLWLFATAGRGTPGPWDAPRHFVALGPYRWVRNPMYISVLLVVLGEAGLFLSVPLLLYAFALAVVFHMVVVLYEEPTLRNTFGETYRSYLLAVPRWIPRPPRR